MSRPQKSGVSPLDHLSSHGGKICVLLIVVALAIVAAVLHVPWAEKLAFGAFAALIAVMGIGGGR